MKVIAELIKAIAHFAWPMVAGLALWWFRKPIAKLMDRIWKFKAFGTELETREEIDLALENTKSAISEAIERAREDIKQAEAAVRISKAEGTLNVTGTATPRLSAKANVVRAWEILDELAISDPRAAIKRAWELLAQAILAAANVSGPHIDPMGSSLQTALQRLGTNVNFSESLIRSIANLREIARKVYYQSQYAYDPSVAEAQRFVLYSTAVKNDLEKEAK